MKLWQYLALLSGAIIATVMALASISYNATLGTPAPAFPLLPVSNSVLFSCLALAFDLGMIASVFGFLHWRHRSISAAVVCAVLFAIASLYSIHSVRGYIAQNVTKSLAPGKRTMDVYTSLKLELQQSQAHLAQLRSALIKAKRRERKTLEREVAELAVTIRETRSTLAQTDRAEVVSPLAGLEWFLALTLWFFNATCWGAWFGYKTYEPSIAHDTVTEWLAQFGATEPQHCALLHSDYANWCEQHRHVALAQYNFYARLIELGARKFRDGRNGPTKYALP